jgi:hypothetical protein
MAKEMNTYSKTLTQDITQPAAQVMMVTPVICI